MYFRIKRSGGRDYVQLVENKWKEGKSRQRVLATVGRREKVLKSGMIDSLVKSAARLCGNIKSSINYFQDETMTSHQVSRLLKVSPSTVISWIDKGKLAAYRTPGGHRRVRLADLEGFVTRTKLPTPLFSGPERHQRIFVVDDEPRVLRAIQRIFAIEEGPYEVQGCTDGVEALVLIGAQPPDLVLLDIHMDGLDGFEVCRRLKRIERLDGLKIVAMSAHPTDEARKRILECGALAYLPKPIQARQIIEILNQQPVVEVTS